MAGITRVAAYRKRPWLLLIGSPVACLIILAGFVVIVAGGGMLAGGGSKTDAKRAIYERALLAIDRLSPPLRARAQASGGAPDGYLRVARAPEDVMIVVAGGVGRKGAYLPTWSGTTKAVSRRVD